MSHATAPATRDPRLDTAKGVLIALVVAGHLLEAIDQWHVGASRVPLTAVYLFHMPAFAFLAGVTASPRRVCRRVATMLVLLAVFQLVLFATWTHVESWKHFSWTRPFWVLWFLLAMAWWQALVPSIRRAPRTAVALSAVAALGAGGIDAIGGGLALSRTLVFLPFFVAGAAFGGALMARTARTATSTRAALTLACAALVAIVLHADIGRAWLYASNGYAGLNVDPAAGMAVRATLLGTAALMTWTLLAWVPTRPLGSVTVAGRRSLGIYLLHGPVVMAVTPALAGVIGEHGVLAAWTLCLVGTAGLVALLSSPGPDSWVRTGAAAVVERGADASSALERHLERLPRSRAGPVRRASGPPVQSSATTD